MTDRESIWTVPRAWRGLYFVLYSVQVIVCAGLVIWHEVFLKSEDSALETFMAIGRGAAPFVLVVAAETVILVEVLFMLSEWYLERRYRQGKTEGRVEGLAEEYRRWEAWNNRRLAAEAQGLPFDEPPPSLPTQDNGRS